MQKQITKRDKAGWEQERQNKINNNQQDSDQWQQAFAMREKV